MKSCLKWSDSGGAASILTNLAWVTRSNHSPTDLIDGFTEREQSTRRVPCGCGGNF